MDDEKYNRILDRLDDLKNQKWDRFETLLKLTHIKLDLVISKLVNEDEYKEIIKSIASDATAVEAALKSQQPPVN